MELQPSIVNLLPDVEKSREVDKIPDEIPTANVNCHIDSVKKRRSSLRRSVNGGFSSTLRALSAGAASLPPGTKKRCISELCLNHTLQDYQNTVPDDEQDIVLKIQALFTKQLENILSKVECGSLSKATKQETETRKYIKQLKEETTAWNDEYKKRRQAHKDARAKAKEVQGRNIMIDVARLRSEDSNFMKTLPDFSAVHKKICVYRERHCLGIISLEKNARRVNRILHDADKKLDDIQSAIVPPSFRYHSCS